MLVIDAEDMTVLHNSGPGPVNVAGKMVGLAGFFTSHPVGGHKVFCSDGADGPSDDAAFAHQGGASGSGSSLQLLCGA